MKAHIFLIVNPKSQVKILCSFGDITKCVKLNGIPENNFLCIFITASSPGVHTFFCLLRGNKKLPEGHFPKCISEVKVNQLKVKNMHVRMGISTFKIKSHERLSIALVTDIIIKGPYLAFKRTYLVVNVEIFSLFFKRHFLPKVSS